MASSGADEAAIVAQLALADARANVAFAASLLTHCIKRRLDEHSDEPCELLDLDDAIAHLQRAWSTCFPEATAESIWIQEHIARARAYIRRSHAGAFDRDAYDHAIESFGHMARFLDAPYIALALRDRVFAKPFVYKAITKNSKKKSKVSWQQCKDDGNGCYTRREFDAAMAHYTTALWYSPKEPTLYSNRALCELQLKKFDLARQDANDALALSSSGSVKLYRILSEALVGLHWYHDALVECEKGLALDPNDSVLLSRSKHCVHVLEEMEWQTQVAIAGVQSAQLELGRKFASGHRGYRRDAAKATLWLEKAGRPAHEIRAMLAFGDKMLAYEAEHGGDHELSLEARTHRFCHVLLDSFKPSDDGTQAHWSVVASHFKAAYDRGLPGAGAKYAQVLRLGIGTPINTAAAADAVLHNEPFDDDEPEDAADEGTPGAACALDGDADGDDEENEFMDVAETYFRSAWDALDARDVAAAIADLREVLDMDDEPSVFVDFARIVLAWLERGTSVVPLSGPWHHLLDAELAHLRREGDDMYTHQLYAKAIEFYSRALDWTELRNDVLRIAPINAVERGLLYWKRALAGFHLGLYGDVCADMEDAVELTSNNIAFYRLWAKAALLDHDYDAVMDICDDGLQLDPHDKDLLSLQDDAEAFL
ncbi:hypothetical protein SPRG_04690 [Saprolegnia parasitica CBS 223.65]|uniref:Uncharacterized protein n=1 Tax=Saprolegnia parasitica (strain CBS 223.65) TaxID=695850 RepID=A0A067CJ89_SAPPC|nr:hypothetical protein SPRG_04690 [Saprolegnia parasitica CBS 223.65]KDO30789.1 hypothetical protein SPRG_04690 [Saprolegnia parasitica CBS 223.65]|eukprot:XP_012198486.1 hypothetical protein SPRG_04690 [Saprolegnia parasitica CBS 223.65]